MERVLLRLISMSLSAGWLVLAVIAIRAVLRKVPRRIICLLWALVAVRLLCPFSIESRVSLVPRAETVMQSAQQVIPAEFALQQERNAEPSSVTVLSCVWLAGTATMLLWAGWSNLRVRRRVRVSIPQGARVRICDEIDTPFVLGILRPQIYLPSRLNPAQTVYVLAHENAHIARRDHWWKPLGWMLLSVYWLQPLLWLAYVLFCRDLELACDERVAERLDRPGLAAYSEALLRCSGGRRGDLAMPVAFGEVGVKTRVKAILRYHRPGRRLVASSLAVVLAVSVLFLTDRPALAAQLQALLPAVDEDAWTIRLDDYHQAPDTHPEPSASPELKQDDPVTFARQTEQITASQNSASATAQTSSAPQPSSSQREVVIDWPILNVTDPDVSNDVSDRPTPSTPPSSFSPAPSILPLVAGADSSGVPGPKNPLP